jgi:UDP-sugar pyrophosphorylase
MAASPLPNDVKEVITDREQLQLFSELCRLGQSHVLLNGFQKTKDGAKLRALAAQLVKLNKGYPEGLKGYIGKARTLLEDSKNGVNPLDGWKPSVPEGEKFELGTEKYDATEKEGMKYLGKVGFVLVAGGLGERLGYNGAKVSVPFFFDRDDTCRCCEKTISVDGVYFAFFLSLSLARLDCPQNRQPGPCTFNTMPSTSKRSSINL